MLYNDREDEKETKLIHRLTLTPSQIFLSSPVVKTYIMSSPLPIKFCAIVSGALLQQQLQNSFYLINIYIYFFNFF
jgi:hypothetical protein